MARPLSFLFFLLFPEQVYFVVTDRNYVSVLPGRVYTKGLILLVIVLTGYTLCDNAYCFILISLILFPNRIFYIAEVALSYTVSSNKETLLPCLGFLFVNFRFGLLNRIFLNILFLYLFVLPFGYFPLYFCTFNNFLFILNDI
jgi:hypothetical protein